MVLSYFHLLSDASEIAQQHYFAHWDFCPKFISLQSYCTPGPGGNWGVSWVSKEDYKKFFFWFFVKKIWNISDKSNDWVNLKKFGAKLSVCDQFLGIWDIYNRQHTFLFHYELCIKTFLMHKSLRIKLNRPWLRKTSILSGKNLDQIFCFGNIIGQSSGS